MRWLAVGLLLLATAPTQSVVAQILEVPFEHNIELWLTFINDEPLQGKTRLDLHSQASRITVQVRRSGPDEPFHPEMVMQAWVLRSDGTALERRAPSRVTGPGRTKDWIAIFAFEPSNVQDLAAVVVSLDGVLFVRPIPHKPRLD